MDLVSSGITRLTYNSSSERWARQRSSSATVSGRVFGSNGLGIKNATVTFTNLAGVRQAVKTNSFGIYSIDILVAPSYTMSVSSKIYRFASVKTNVFGAMANVDVFGVE